jgi:DNA-binding response OmpR family regulator
VSRAEGGMARILVVEDEAHLAEGLLFNLQAEGYEVELAGDGESALARLLPAAEAGGLPRDMRSGLSGETRVGISIDNFGAEVSADRGTGRRFAFDPEQDGGLGAAGSLPEFDAVLLDVMLPGKSGFEVVSALRAAGVYVPVLMLTARGRPEDVLHGLEAGADDYLAKPFDLGILLARIRVLLRRMRWQGVGRESSGAGLEAAEQELPATYSFAGRTIDFSLLELTAKGAITRLTLMEADFLRYLSLHPFRIIPRKELLEQVWRVHEDTDTRAIDNFVVRLRRYLEDEPANPVYLKTVRGVGYRFLPHGE